VWELVVFSFRLFFLFSFIWISFEYFIYIFIHLFNSKFIIWPDLSSIMRIYILIFNCLLRNLTCYGFRFCFVFIFMFVQFQLLKLSYYFIVWIKIGMITFQEVLSKMKNGVPTIEGITNRYLLTIAHAIKTYRIVFVFIKFYLWFFLFIFIAFTRWQSKRLPS
jgi:hypothetical protein